MAVAHRPGAGRQNRKREGEQLKMEGGKVTK